MERGILSDSQWGFLPGRSTVSALLSTVHHWFQLLEEGKEVCAVFFDFRKAFDSVATAWFSYPKTSPHWT